MKSIRDGEQARGNFAATFSRVETTSIMVVFLDGRGDVVGGVVILSPAFQHYRRKSALPSLRPSSRNRIEDATAGSSSFPVSSPPARPSSPAIACKAPRCSWGSSSESGYRALRAELGSFRSTGHERTFAFAVPTPVGPIPVAIATPLATAVPTADTNPKRAFFEKLFDHR
jgi:hypothetical protein